jgi:hypothetical protein
MVMQRRTLTLLRAPLVLSLALLGFPSLASADDPFGVCYWPVDEGSGSATDTFICSESDMEGTLGSSAHWALEGDRTYINISPSIWGDTAGYVEFGPDTASFLGASDFTVLHSFRTGPTGSAGSALFSVLGTRSTYGHGNFFAVRMRGDGILTVELDEDTLGTNYVGLTGAGHPVNDGVWHYLAYVRDGAQLSLYIDGELIASASTASGQPTWISGASPFRLGLEDPANTWPLFSADYDNLVISYGIAMSQEQIQSLANIF